MTKELIKTSYERLTNQPFSYQYKLSYSGHFKGFNASITRNWQKIHLKLSKDWREISEEIKIGLIQELLIKSLKLKKTKTMNIDLYNNFLRNAHLAVPKTKTHPILSEAFDKLNQQFFDNTLESVNFGLSNSLTTLGTYHYGSDTITITKHLLEDLTLLEYVMYHEMLHKHHKFSSNICRNLHHSKEFRDDERKFPNWEEQEKKLNNLIRNKRITQRREENAGMSNTSSWLKRIFS